MTESKPTCESEVKKSKVSFKDAVKQQLEAKKSKQTGNNPVGGTTQETKKLKSQQAKKVNNSHRKMGV